MVNNMSDVSTINQSVQVWQNAFPLVRALLGGTQAMRLAKRTFLPQFPKEDDVSYQSRLNVATLLPVFAETVENMVGRVFFKSMARDAVDSRLLLMLDDVDCCGSGVDAFGVKLFRSALAYGRVYVVVDMPKAEDIKTRADELAHGVRPYAYPVYPEQVLGIKKEIINGKNTITQFRFKSKTVVDDGEFGEKEVETITVLTRGLLRVYRNIDGEWVLYEQAELKTKSGALNRVNVVELKLADLPPLLELAYLNVKHYQSQSDQDAILHTARVPLLVMTGADSDEPFQVSGGLVRLPDGGDLRYVEHSGAAISAGQQSLDALEEQMKAAGAKLLSTTKLAMTDSQARDVQQNEVSLLRRYANQFENALNNMLDLFAMWLGFDDGGKLAVSGNIDADFNPSASFDAVLKMQGAGVLSDETVFNEAKRRGLVAHTIDWQEEDEKRDKADLGFE